MIPIENWARIRGRVQGVENATVADYIAVHLELEAIESVEGFPNRLHRKPGDDLTVLVRRAAVTTIDPGSILVARVRRASLDRVFAHPEDVKIDPA